MAGDPQHAAKESRAGDAARPRCRTAQALAPGLMQRADRDSVAPPVGNLMLQSVLRGGRPPRVQLASRISMPGDPWEQEAERIADAVVSRSPAAASCTCGTGTPCTACGGEEAPISRKAAAVGTPVAPGSPDVKPAGSGQPLDRASRAFFEGRLGRDFGDVRVHTDRAAAVSADALAAEAYTTGTDIVFANGRYAPETSRGQRLLAHELAHVVQQSQVTGLPVQRYVAVDVMTTPITRAQAEQMTQPELDQAIQRLRSYLSTVVAETADSARASANLAVLEGLAIDRQGTGHPGQTPAPVPVPVPTPTSTPPTVDDAQLNQCIAELGGDPRYRDGGIASPEELAQYREECLRRQGGTSRAIENLRRAWEYAKQEIGPEVSAQLEGLFSPASIAAMVAFAALYIGAQFTPVGWIADAFALTLLTLTVICVGTLVYQVARDVIQFLSAIDATSDDELREDGHALARALARAGIGIVLALLTHAIGGGGGVEGPPSATAPARVMVMATEGGPVSAPVIVADTVADAVQASRLQQLASYAVMVPPPGGTSPDAPVSSSSGGGGTGGGSRTATDEPTSGEGGPGGGAGGFSLTRVGYGDGPLSQLAQALRLRLGLRRGGNVAVFEFDSIPDRFRSLTARLGGRNVLIEGNRMAVQNVGGAAHSEALADQLIQAGRRAGLQLTVRRIYTEYNPCTDTCLPLIQRNYPSAQVSYSFIWERWGRETPDRNAAVDALFQRAGGHSGE